MAIKLNRWLVKLNDKTVCIYADQRNNVLYCKTFGANGWEEKVLIADNVTGNLSVTIGEDGDLYVFCMDSAGNIMLCVNNAGKWSSNIIQENRTQSIHDIYFHVSMSNDSMDILYNFPDGPNKTYGLFYRNVSKGGRWSEPIKIDTIAPFSNAPFVVQKVSGKHYVVFYQTKNQETNIEYREVSFETKKWSDAHQIFRSGYTCPDVSFLTTNNAIHVLIIVLGMFSYQLLYMKKLGSEFTKPILLYEGQRIENCLLHILDGSILCTFFVGGQMYICKSDNMGESFSRPAKYKYKYKYDINLVKTIFLSNSPISGNQAFLNCVYTEEDNVGSIALVTDFYPNILIPKASPPPPPKSSPKPLESERDISYGFKFPSMMYGSQESAVPPTPAVPTGSADVPVTDNELLKTQILYLTRQMEKKEQQLLALTSQLKEKERLAASSEAIWREKYAQLAQENKQAIAELESRLLSIQSSISANEPEPTSYIPEAEATETTEATEE